MKRILLACILVIAAACAGTPLKTVLPDKWQDNAAATRWLSEHVGSPMGVKWFAKEGAPNRYQAAGDWINFRAGDSVDIDIVTGESPGGQYRCMLAVQKRGGPILPAQFSVSKETPAGARPWRGMP